MILRFTKCYTMLAIVATRCIHFAETLLTDLVRLEYSFVPKNNSEGQYTRFRVLFNNPIETRKDCYFIVGTEYDRIILNFEDDYPLDTSLLETIDVIDLNIASLCSFRRLLCSFAKSTNA